MAELLTPQEVFFTAFEPKVQNRYVMYLEGIPAYLIKTDYAETYSSVWRNST